MKIEKTDLGTHSASAAGGLRVPRNHGNSVGQPGGGVQISAVGSSKDCEAYRLATFYMSKFYPEWYRRYETVLKEPEIYFDFSDSRTGVFSWNITSDKSGLSDKDGFRDMSAAQVLYDLFKVSPIKY